jgi:amino acid adenylation domain-containing protein/non-ribosomal peptide synthase protein (TIGR01720 family)
VRLPAQGEDLTTADLLLAATALTFAEWTTQPRILVEIETHGRDSAFGAMDVLRTVGWFTSSFPVLVDLPMDTTNLDAVVRLVAAQARSAPHRGASYGLLRHGGAAAIETAFAGVSRAGILLNYHGRGDLDARTGWRLSAANHGADRSPRQRREYFFEINGVVTGDRLHVTLGYGRALHRDETARALARRFESRLRAIVDACHRHARQGNDDVEDAYELSPTQHGILYHALYQPEAQAYFNQLSCELTGPLNVDLFCDAWRIATARHPALRTTFHSTEAGRPLQTVHVSVDIPWSVEDWSRMPADEQERRWLLASADDRQRPFDLTRAPLMRCALYRIGDARHRFRWSHHHLLLDGWSASIVLGDVIAAYDALVEGEPHDPPAPPLFRDHLAWLQRRDQAQAERFWRADLSGFTSPTPLVLGLPEIEGRAQAGLFAEAETTVPLALTARLKALAATRQLTLNTLFQGVWAMILSRYSGQHDIVFGAITSGRPAALADSDRMVGLFINTMPVRVHADPSEPVVTMLRRLQRDNAEREPYSYSSLADVQRWSGVEGGVPLFETIFIFENYPVAASLLDRTHALGIERVHAEEPNTYPLTFVVTPGDSIGLKIMFDQARHDRGTIERCLGHVQTMIAGVEAMPDGQIGALPLLTDSERCQFAAWNRTHKPLPDNDTVLSLFERHARTTPDRTAATCAGESVSYGGLNARANQLARVMTRTGRIQPGARVAVLLRRSLRLVEAVLAVWKCGAAYVPVDPDHPDARIAATLSRAKPALILFDPRELAPARAAAMEHAAPWLSLEDIAGPAEPEAAADLHPSRDLSATAYVIFTSGSTGVPKAAMLQHGGFLNHVLSMVEDLSLGPASIVAQTASHGFDISMWQLFAPLVAGGTAAIYPDGLIQRPVALAECLDAEQVTVAQFVPSYLNVFMDALDGSAMGPPSLRTMTHMILIGETLTRTTVDRWFAMYPRVPLMNAYGPTEASDSVTHFHLTRPPPGTAVSLGRPIQNTALYIVDPAMQLCPIGVKGEICIGGAGVGRGYLFDEARTRERFLEDPFTNVAGARIYKSGDLGCYAPDGSVYFLGRNDSQVKVRGHRIEPGDVESCLAALGGVRDAAVVTRPDEAGDTMLCAYVVPLAGRTLSAHSLTTLLSERLPRAFVPAVLQVLPRLPVMSNGKIDRRALAAMPIDGPETVVRTPPATATELALARIWCDVLGRADIGVDESFFDLGGHSLRAMEIVNRIARDLGAEIGIADVFGHSCVRSLARLIDATSTVAAGSRLVAQPAQEHADTSPMQRRIWLASRTPEGSAAYNMAAAFWLTGDIDVPAMQRAFRTLVSRHDTLRTAFVLLAGSLRQKVRALDDSDTVLRETRWTSAAPGGADLQAIVRARAAVPFDLERAPLADAELMRFPDGTSLLLVRLHHIVGDAASLRIVMDEAIALYAAFRLGEPTPLPPLPIQHRDFVAWQNARAAESAFDRSQQYWRDTLNGVRQPAGFTPDRPLPAHVERFSPDPPSTPPASTPTMCEVEPALTLRLRQVAGRHDTTLFAVLLSAIYGLLHRHTGHEDLVVGTTVSRRIHPLLERQVGCYVDTLPLRVRARGHETSSALVDTTARTWREALLHQESLFDFESPLFDVLVDYVPGTVTVPALAERAGLAITDFELDAQDAHYDSMFLISDADAETSLSIQLVFNPDLFTTGMVASLGARLHEILRWMAADGQEPLNAVDLMASPRDARRRVRVNLARSPHGMP